MDIIQQFPNLSPKLQKEILDSPAIPAPIGSASRLIDPPGLTACGYAVGAVCLFLTLSTFGFRLYGRIAVVKSIHLEDYIGCIAMACYLGSAVGFYLQGYFGGFQTHTWDIRFREYRHALENGLILSISYSATMLFIKVAILLEWTRIFVPAGTRDAFFWASRVLIVLNVLVYVLCIFLQGFACIPIKALWTPWIHGKCLEKKTIDLTTGYFNLVMDAFILVLPWKVLWKLRMTRRRKIGIALLFSVGILTIASAVTRIILNTYMKYVYRDTTFHPGDINYQYSTIVYFLFIEQTLIVLVYCMWIQLDGLPPAPKGFIESPIGRYLAKLCQSIASSTTLRYEKTANNSKANTSKGRDNLYQEATPRDSSEIELNQRTKVSTMGDDDRSDQVDHGIVRRIDIESQIETPRDLLRDNLYRSRYRPWEPAADQPHAF